MTTVGGNPPEVRQMTLIGAAGVDVACWPKADMTARHSMSAFGGTANIRLGSPNVWK